MLNVKGKWVLATIVIAVGMFSWASEARAADSLLVAEVSLDFSVLQVVRFDAETDAFVDTFLPMGTGGMFGACCFVWGPDQNLYVGDPIFARVVKFSPTGEFLGEFVPPGSGGLVLPLAVIFGPDGRFYVGDLATGAILRYDGTTGAFIDELAPPGTALGQQFMTFGPDGDLYINAWDTPESVRGVLRFDLPTGEFLGSFATIEADHTSGLAFGENGYLYVATTVYTDTGSVGSISRFDGTTGAFIDSFIPPGSAGLSDPVGIAFGPNDDLYVADLFSGVFHFDGTTGAFIDVLPVLGPRGLTFSPKFDVCHTSKMGLKKKTLSVGHLEVEEHVGHGDALGACPGGALTRQIFDR